MYCSSFFSSRRRHTRWNCDWSSDVCSSDLPNSRKQGSDPDATVGAGKIIIKGARTHNLKNISVEIPRNKMVVFTGLSGSGKSSLAFDTIFAEGQRKYVESLSAYARQFL